MPRFVSVRKRFAIDLVLKILFGLPLFARRVFRAKDVGPVKKILILELWGIGDVVLASCVLRPLRAKFPDASLTLLSPAYGRILLENTGLVDHFIEWIAPWTAATGKYRFWDWDWRALVRLIRQLRAQRFTLVLDARGDVRNNILTFLVHPKQSFGYNWSGGGFLLDHNFRLECREQHRVEAWRNLLKNLAIDVTAAIPNLVISTHEQKFRDEFFFSSQVKDGLRIGIHPGAKSELRRWSLQNFQSIAQWLADTKKMNLVIFTDESGYGLELTTRGDFDNNSLVFGGSLRQLIAVISGLDLLLCNDTGVMHIAAALGIPTVAIFGPGDQRHIGPYGAGHTIVEIPDVSCRPCFDRCIQPRPFCIQDISLEQVQEALRNKIDVLRNSSGY